MDLKEAFSSTNERKEEKMHLGSLIKSLQPINDIIKRAQSLVYLIAFIVFRNLFGVENCI